MSQFEYDEPVVVEPGEAIKFKSDPEGVQKLFEEVLNVVPKASRCSDPITTKKKENNCMYLVFAEWEGEVSYGVDSSTYLLEIVDDEDAAMDVIQEFGPRLTDCRIGESSYYEIPEDKRDLFEKKYSISNKENDGVYLMYCSEFKPGMFCGGAFYLE